MLCRYRCVSNVLIISGFLGLFLSVIIAIFLRFYFFSSSGTASHVLCVMPSIWQRRV